MSSRVVLSDDQMEALADPLRSDLFLTLRAYGSGSATDLSTRLAVDAKSLYYPLKKLLAAGLISILRYQKGKRKAEAVYGLTADRFELNPAAPPEVRAKLVRTTIRSAERGFLAAQAANARGLSIQRSQLWLTPADRAEFDLELAKLTDRFEARSKVGEGELLYWTSLVSPAVR